jgi:hypothetical protein
MNKTITNLVSKGIKFTVADFQKNKVMDTVSKIIAKNQLDLFMVKMKMTMLNLNSNQNVQGHIKNNQNNQMVDKSNQ